MKKNPNTKRLKIKRHRMRKNQVCRKKNQEAVIRKVVKFNTIVKQTTCEILIKI